MRIIIFTTFLLISFNSFGYECKSVKFDLSTQSLKKIKREAIFQGFIFEIADTPGEKSFQKALTFSDFLMNTEADPNQRAFLELLRHSSELDKGKIKALKLSEICDLNSKVENLKK